MIQESKERLRFRLWPMLQGPAIPAYLEYLETKGLRLHHMTAIPMIAVFTQTKQISGEEAVGKYCWDYFESDRREDLEGYVEACGITGWDVVWQFGKHKIMRRSWEREPVSVRTPEEYEVLLKKRGSKAAFGNLCGIVVISQIIAWLCAFGTGWVIPSGFYAAGLNVQSFLIGVMLFFLFGGAAAAGGILIFTNGVNRCRRGEPPLLRSESILILKHLTLAGQLVFFITTLLLFGAFFSRDSGIRDFSASLVYLIFSPFSVWEGYVCLKPYGEGRKETREMPMIPGLRPRTNSWVALAVLIPLTLAILYGTMNLLPKDHRYTNLYCSEIYADNRESNVSNQYFQVKKEEDVSKVLQGLAGKRYLELSWDAVKPGDSEKLLEIVNNPQMAVFLEDSDWDCIYDGGSFFLVICRDREIWCVANWEKDFSEVEAFLQKTDF